MLRREREAVPDSFLLPLLPAGAAGEVQVRRRAAYVAILWERLRGPRTFNAMAYP